MEIRPILSAMLRNKTGAVLVVLQIALTMAVVVNASFIINQRLEKMNRDTGIDVDNILIFQSWGFGDDYNHEASITRDIEYIRSMPGVIAVTPTRSLPVSNSGSANDFRATAERFDENNVEYPSVNANTYVWNEQGIDAVGVKLAAGRSFYAEEVQFRESRSSEFAPVTIITKDLAIKMFGTEDALGKTVYDFFGNAAEVVGIIEHMQGAWIDWDELTNVIISPGVSAGPFIRFMVRTEAGRRDELIAAIEEQLPKLDRGRMIRRVEPFSDVVRHAYSRDHSMTILLLSTIILLVSITSLGIIGLASFAVRQRTKQIGTRRAVGATRMDIVRYFMMENWLVTTIGVVLGSILALAFNVWLVDTYALDKLDWHYIPLGMLALWVLGQVAVLMPAMRASTIAPAVATRTV
ncbi:MAG: FtsX-like permease family protein [Gammaproteobacteria bacterium]|nr:FtsX-like permease family protein [Gammaproteobacteria bacterium]